MVFEGKKFTKVRKIWDLLTEPHESILGIRKRQQAKLVSTLLLVAIPIFLIIQFTSELMVEASITYVVACILVFILYLISRTQYFDIALYLTLIGISYIPIVVFLFGTYWQISDLPRLMVWIIVALILGTLTSRTIIVLIQGLSMTGLMTFIVAVLSGLPFSAYDAHVATSLIVTFFVVIVSYMLESYVNQASQYTSNINLQRRELEVYTQLLRHDLRNDLQAILSSIELADLVMEINPSRAKENLQQSLTLGERMVNLLHVFSMPLVNPKTNIVDHIKDAANMAQKTYPSLKIEISCTLEARKRTFTSSRLLSMVWTNIFRNSAVYAGSNPIVHIDISLDNDMFRIVIRDDGPGIPDDEKDWIFKRGSDKQKGEHGFGLYLSRIVVESHGGRIELVETPEEKGAEFLIQIPITDLEG